MTIYCPTCNRSSDDTRFIGNFCEYCTIKKIEKQIPDSVVIHKCKSCGRILEGRTFVELKKGSLADTLEIEMKLKSNWRVKVRGFDDKQIDAIFIDTYENEKVGFEKMIDYKMVTQMCQRCDRISAGYYEAVVQLRGDWDRVNNLIRKIEKYVERRYEFVAKIEKVEGGQDLYISNKLMMNEFFHDYDLKPTRSFRLYGMKNGRRLYRNTYSLHL